MLVSCQCSGQYKQAVAFKCVIQFRYVTAAFSLYSDIVSCLPLLLDHALTLKRTVTEPYSGAGYVIQYSGTPLNGHPSTADTCDITDNSECPDCISIDFNIFKPPQQRTPRYSYNGHLFWSRSSLRNSEQPRITDS